MSKKIVILGSAHPLRGGIAAYNEHLARAFQQKGDDVIIYNFSLQYPNFLFPGKTQFSSEPAPKDIEIRTEVNSVNPINWLRIGKKIKKLKPDLLIIKYWLPFMAPCLGTIAREVKKNKHTRVVSVIDNIIPHEKKPLDKILSNYFVKSVDGFVVMSDAVMKDLDLFDKNKARKFCYHPLYDHYGDILIKAEAKKKLNLDINTNYILFFGFIRDYKGLDLLLEAMTLSPLKERKIKLLVAGEFYTDSKPYFDYIEKNNLSEKVIMSNDFIPDSRVNEYFCAADLIVQPYKDATQSGVTQIAYHFNKAMIVTNVGGLAEIVPHNKCGYVIEPKAEDIAIYINRFYEDNKEEEFSANASLEKQKYSWENLLTAIEEVAS